MLTEDHANWPLPPLQPNDYTAATATVTDNITGLMWQRSILGTTKRQWAFAQAACDSLTLGGFSDWSLPTVNELRSLLDQTAIAGPAIDQTAFPGTPSGDFWSSTPDVANSAFAWWVDSTGGMTGAFSKTAFTNYYRCVRNRPPPVASRYTVDAPQGTVMDNATGLTWKAAPESGTYDANTAPAVCSSPWRLPNANELLSLVDFTRQNPALDASVFPGVTTQCFWSVVPSMTAGFSWHVCFDKGRVQEASSTNLESVRCVQ